MVQNNPKNFFSIFALCVLLSPVSTQHMALLVGITNNHVYILCLNYPITSRYVSTSYFLLNVMILRIKTADYVRKLLAVSSKNTCT